MNDFDANKSYKKQKLTVHEMMEKADKAKGGKGGLHSVVSHNVKTERHGPNKGKTVVRIQCVFVSLCLSGNKLSLVLSSCQLNW